MEITYCSLFLPAVPSIFYHFFFLTAYPKNEKQKEHVGKTQLQFLSKKKKNHINLSNIFIIAIFMVSPNYLCRQCCLEYQCINQKIDAWGDKGCGVKCAPFI